MNSCTKCCRDNKVACPNSDCRYWIDYGEDLNCSIIAVDKHGPMTLRQVGERLGISFVRIKQIEDKTKKKVWKKFKNDKNLLSVLPDYSTS